MAFLTREQIDKIGFAKVGHHVFISDKASFYNPSKISMESYIRIDDFCILSAGLGGIELDDYVHIGCYTSLIGEAKIAVGFFCGISPRVSVFSSSDDYSGRTLPSLTHIQEKYKNLNSTPVIFQSYSMVATSSVILPGVTIGEGTVVGALSLVRKSLKPWSIYTGNPLRYITKRSQDMLQFMPEIKKTLV
ncbi:MAG TPA: acyltransferase [Hanamia sp.]